MRVKKIAEFEERFHELVDESDSETVFLFEDECYIRDYQALCATWSPKGCQTKIKTYGQHKGVGLFGVMDYKRGDIIVQSAEQLNTQAFLPFIEEKVLPVYSGRKVVMILDNARIHHAHITAEAMDKYKDSIELMFLPPYAPNVNRIEGLWKWLKHDAICNVFLKTKTHIDNAVSDFLAAIKYDRKAIMKRLCW